MCADTSSSSLEHDGCFVVGNEYQLVGTIGQHNTEVLESNRWNESVEASRVSNRIGRM